MSYTETVTLIPIVKFAEHFGIDPYHYFSITTTQRPYYPSCDEIFYKWDYQFAGKVSRESIAYALKQAEDLVIEHLNYAPIPVWFEDEEHVLDTHYDPMLYNYRNAYGGMKSLTANRGYVVDVGKRTKTLIDDDATIVWLDSDLDGFFETAQVIVATTVTDEQELRVYFPGHSARDNYEIRPLKSVTIVGGFATIQFPRYLVVLEELQEKVDDPAVTKLVVDGDDDTNFLTEVEVWRVWTDPSQQVTLYTEYGYSCSTGVPGQFTTETGALTIRDRRLGVLAYTRADWNATTQAYTEACWEGVPSKATINYYAGKQDDNLPMPNREMNKAIERMIVYYASTLLNTELCGCSNVKHIFDTQTLNMAMSVGGKSFTLPWNLVNNPFGTTVAGINLYRWVYAEGNRIVK